ncbi:DUF3891 family protein [Roseococcus pinisoli]|uniref:DUF3891 family protein n=1 Tax=Roseococcus pinisoli TaxID=2835040 RepID=A0ABS5QAU6_9PROT|nr:DUF3891 family protein [Roseococcus pinisoli]MBS7810052.1 DUF3891 family protein [Roseococcus pinisoli]
MILWKQEDGSVLATPQPAHAVLSGQLMRVLAEPPVPFEPVVTAAAQHDCGWMRWEADPDFDAETGLPTAFNAVPGVQHVALWEAGVRLALASWGLWAGLLVLRHGSFIYRLGLEHHRQAGGDENRRAMQGYIDREPAWSALLAAKLGVTEAQVAANARKVAMVDAIALALCWGRDSFDSLDTMLRRRSPFEATLDPWPLSVPEIVLETETLRLPARFSDSGEMRAGLAEAPRIPLRFRLTPA